MAYTELTVAVVTDAGAAPSFANADTVNGNKFENDGKTYLEIFNNGSTGDGVVTIETGRTVKGKTVTDNPITVTQGNRKRVGPFPPDLYNIESGSDAGCVRMLITGAGAADVDLQAFK